MTDDELEAALCRVSALNDTQIAGLTVLAAMSEVEVAEFGRRVDAAWQANIDSYQSARQRLVAAQRERAGVEVECGNAARARHRTRPVLNDDEVTRVRAAESKVAAARAGVEAARVRFKAGVTEQQIEAVG